MSKKQSFFNLDVTLEHAVKQFSRKVPDKMAEQADVPYDQHDSIHTVRFIDSDYLVQYPSGNVTLKNGEPASTYVAIIILHYMITANGQKLTGRWIAYRHLPGGDIYIDPFNNRAVKPFLRTFGEIPDEYEKSALAMGGTRLSMSGISIKIPVLPRVPICFQLWPGDDEMPASANILFDETASGYLPTEDYAHLPAMVVGAMKNYMKT